MRTDRALVAAVLVAGGLLAAGACQAQADSREPIVIGILVAQGTDGSEARALAGARAHIGRINEGGGINGRKLRIASESFDPGALSAYAEKLRRLIATEKPVALFGCGDDATCEAAAAIAKEAQVPLVGPLSGSSMLSRRVAPHVFRLRVGYEREAAAISGQFRQLGSSRVAVVTDTASAGEAERVLLAALARDGMQVNRMPLAGVSKPALAALVQKLGDEGVHGAVMNVRADTIRAIINNGLSERTEWPRILMTMANGSISAYTSNFKGRVVGFTQVVPNPDVMALPLSRELDEDASRYSGALAWTHEGMEGYVTARLLVSALRKVGPQVTPERLAATLASPEPWDISGFRLNFARDRETGSDWVEIGLRSREGVLVR
jgi:branched-chain amino acid transport system substrate-binding protein